MFVRKIRGLAGLAVAPAIKPSFLADPVFVATLRQARADLAKEATEVANLKKRQRDQQTELLQLIQGRREKLREQRRHLESSLSSSHVLSRVNDAECEFR